MKKKQMAAIYARVSSMSQKVDETIDSQIDTVKVFAQDNDFEVPSEWIFKDEGYSGSILDRPGLDSLRDLIREQCLEAVLVYSPDRLARRYVNQLILKEEFLKYGVSLVFIKGLNAKTPEEQLSEHFQGIFAEYERTQILDRTRRGKLYKAKQGDKRVLVKAPFGYVNDRADYYSIHPHNAKIVKKIFHLYVHDQYTIEKIKKYFFLEGISSPSGRLNWSNKTIRDILSNSAYIGTAYYGKTEKSAGRNERIARYSSGIGRVKQPRHSRCATPEETWVAISVPAIIEESDFQTAQALLERNRQLASRNTKNPSILQGLLVCGRCSRSFYKRTSNSR